MFGFNKKSIIDKYVDELIKDYENQECSDKELVSGIKFSESLKRNESIRLDHEFCFDHDERRRAVQFPTTQQSGRKWF